MADVHTGDYNTAVTPVLADYAHSPATEDDNHGWMSNEDWQPTVDILVGSGQLDTRVEASKLYTNVIPKTGN